MREKIRAMVEWPAHQNIKKLRGFLGLTGYYWRFVHRNGIVAAPVTQILKKGAFKLNDQAQIAFDTLKNVMITLPVLALPDFSLPFVVETRASGMGIGAMLFQQRKHAFFN